MEAPVALPQGRGFFPLILALIAKPLEPRGTDVRPQHHHRIGLLGILFRQFHEEPVAAAPAPAVVLDAADANGQSLAYVYGYSNPRDAGVANALTLDEARRIASNIAKLPTYSAGSP
jgi:hypothetical protein